MLENTETNNSVDVLIDKARRSAQAGKWDEAAIAWEKVLGMTPDNPEALYFLGQRALGQGDAKAAVHWLKRAIQTAPQEAVLPWRLANAYHALGDSSNEMKALEGSLKVDPYFYPALLTQAALLEDLEYPRQAARIFGNALKIMPSEESLPHELQKLAQRAQTAVHENTLALDTFIENRLGKIRETYNGDRLDRFDECKDVMLGRKKIYTQQPLKLHFPQLPAIPFFEEKQFPWLQDLEAETDAIESELISVLKEDSSGFRPGVNIPDGAPINNLTEINRSQDWSNYFFWEYGRRVEDHCQRCPRTASLLEKMPLFDMTGVAPAALFATLKAGTWIPPHTGVNNACLVVHLGLMVPESCTLRVGNETREWKRGKAWVFDDTIEHEAKNDSNQLRGILIFEIWNPYLSHAERDLVSGLVAAYRDYYAAHDDSLTQESLTPKSNEGQK